MWRHFFFLLVFDIVRYIFSHLPGKNVDILMISKHEKKKTKCNCTITIIEKGNNNSYKTEDKVTNNNNNIETVSYALIHFVRLLFTGKWGCNLIITKCNFSYHSRSSCNYRLRLCSFSVIWYPHLFTLKFYVYSIHSLIPSNQQIFRIHTTSCCTFILVPFIWKIKKSLENSFPISLILCVKLFTVMSVAHPFRIDEFRWNEFTQHLLHFFFFFSFFVFLYFARVLYWRTMQLLVLFDPIKV